MADVKRRSYRTTIRRGDAPALICSAAYGLFSTKGYLATSRASTNPAPSTSGKTASSRMRLNLFGNGVAVSMVNVMLTYPKDL